MKQRQTNIETKLLFLVLKRVNQTAPYGCRRYSQCSDATVGRRSFEQSIIIKPLGAVNLKANRDLSYIDNTKLTSALSARVQGSLLHKLNCRNDSKVSIDYATETHGFRSFRSFCKDGYLISSATTVLRKIRWPA